MQICVPNSPLSSSRTSTTCLNPSQFMVSGTHVPIPGPKNQISGNSRVRYSCKCHNNKVLTECLVLVQQAVYTAYPRDLEIVVRPGRYRFSLLGARVLGWKWYTWLGGLLIVCFVLVLWDILGSIRYMNGMYSSCRGSQITCIFLNIGKERACTVRL